jgi:hypothetical protein
MTMMFALLWNDPKVTAFTFWSGGIGFGALILCSNWMIRDLTERISYLNARAVAHRLAGEE